MKRAAHRRSSRTTLHRGSQLRLEEFGARELEKTVAARRQDGACRMKSLDQIRAAEARLPDRTREPATLRAVADELVAIGERNDHIAVIGHVMRDEAKRNIATREERRRRG